MKALMTSAARLLLSLSLWARNLLTHFCMMTAARFISRYLLRCLYPRQRLCMMVAMSFFLIWNASSVSNNVFGKRMNIFVLENGFTLKLWPNN